MSVAVHENGKPSLTFATQIVTKEIYVKAHGDGAMAALQYLETAIHRAAAPSVGCTESTSLILRIMGKLIASRLLRAMRQHPSHYRTIAERRQKRRNEMHSKWNNLSDFITEDRQKKQMTNPVEVENLEDLLLAMKAAYNTLFPIPPKPKGKHDGMVLTPNLVISGDSIFRLLESAWKEAGVKRSVSAATRYKIVHSCLSLSMGVKQIATISAVKQALIRHNRRNKKFGSGDRLYN